MKKNPEKTVLILFFVSGLALFGLVPIIWRAVMPPDAAMLFFIVTLYLAYPIYFAVLGIWMCKRQPRFWWLPFAGLALFLVCWLPWGLREVVFPAVYFVIAYTGVALRALLRIVRNMFTHS